MTTEDETVPEGDRTLPPDHPVPASELGRYTLNHDPHEEAEIAAYVDGQCHGEETVEYVELIKTEYVGGQRFDAWDVHTDKGRWWVLTNGTNLYSQQHFPSLDYTLSFHIGLMLRVQANAAKAGDGEPSPFDEVYRRQDQAADLLERAIEAEEFQAVGMQLRECLFSLVAAIRRRVNLQTEGERPKDADVKAWLDLVAGHLCPGEPNKEMRGYLKATAEKTWQVVNWLTHHRNANRTSARIAFDAVASVVSHSAWLITRERADLTQLCPRCSSRDVRSYYDPAIEPDGDYFERCRSCDWDNHPGYADADEDDGQQAESSA